MRKNKMENYLSERINIAKKMANDIVHQEPKSEDELINKLKFLISKHYNIPFFDDRFVMLSLDDLLLEIYLIQERYIDHEQKISANINENKEDIFQQMFGEEELEQVKSQAAKIWGGKNGK